MTTLSYIFITYVMLFTAQIVRKQKITRKQAFHARMSCSTECNTSVSSKQIQHSTNWYNEHGSCLFAYKREVPEGVCMFMQARQPCRCVCVRVSAARLELYICTYIWHLYLFCHVLKKKYT